MSASKSCLAAIAAVTAARMAEGATLLVGLRQQNLESLQSALLSVSSPSSAEYGKHWDQAKVADLVASSPRDVAAASSWLKEAGATSVRLTSSKDALFAYWPDKQSPAVPAHLGEVVQHVVVLTERSEQGEATRLAKEAEHREAVRERRGRLREKAAAKRRKREAMQSSKQPVVETPLVDAYDLAKQKAAYGVPADLKATNKDNLQMVWGTGTFGYLKNDLSNFYDAYCSECSLDSVSFDKDNVWQGKDGKNYVEGILDTSYISSMTIDAKTLVANTNTSASTESSDGFGAALLAFMENLNARTSDLPLVLSMSLGSLGFDSCDLLCKQAATKGHSYSECQAYLQTQFQVCMFESRDQQDRVNTEFQKLGLRGVTIFAAAGDGGSHFAFGKFQNGALADVLNSISCQFNMPVFPTSSPWVVSIGGTQWQEDGPYSPACSSDKPCGWDSGGGGFSWYYPPATPSQSVVSKAYLKSAVGAPNLSPSSSYNASNRGYPDFSALAAFGIPVCDYGDCGDTGGTSASTPTLAGMFTLINDARLNKGLAPLGFLLPRLYEAMANQTVREECFYDIGHAPKSIDPTWDCDTYSTCEGCDKGFPAIPGWDAQTGFGQPHFPGLLKHLGSD